MKTWIWKAKKEKGNRWYLGTIHQEWLQRRHLQFLCRKHLYTHGIVGTFDLSAGWSVIPLGLVCTYWPCSVEQWWHDHIISLTPNRLFLSPYQFDSTPPHAISRSLCTHQPCSTFIFQRHEAIFFAFPNIFFILFFIPLAVSLFGIIYLVCLYLSNVELVSS